MIPFFEMRNAAYALLTLIRITVGIFLSFEFFKYYIMIEKRNGVIAAGASSCFVYGIDDSNI